MKRGRKLPGSLLRGLLRPRVSSSLLQLRPQTAAAKSLVNRSALQSRLDGGVPLKGPSYRPRWRLGTKNAD